MDPRPVKREMLVGLVDHRVSGVELDFASARQITDRSAREALANPLLLAWFDKKSLEAFPGHLLRRRRDAQLGKVRGDTGSNAVFGQRACISRDGLFYWWAGPHSPSTGRPSPLPRRGGWRPLEHRPMALACRRPL